MSMRISFISPFTRKETCIQRVNPSFIVLSLRDLHSLTINGHDLFQSGPLLFVCLPGDILSFSFGENRLNWVLGCDTPDLAADADPRRCRLRWNGEWLGMPRICALGPAEAERNAAEFRHMRSLAGFATPANRCSLEMGAWGFLRRLLDQDAILSQETPAGRLRQMLDDPRNGNADLKTLSRLCNYSPKHLRLLFSREFHVSPKRYRDRQRMARAMELINGTGFSVKEISSELGFRHMSHFCLAFKRANGISAGEAIRKHRGATG